MAKRTKESYTIQSVVHALDLLEQFHGPDAELGVTELSRRLELHKNNVFRLLATLETCGYVVQDPETEAYRLGVKALELGRAYLRHTDIVGIAGPLLEELRDTTDETAYLSVLQGEELVYLLAEETRRTVRVASRVGQRVPAAQTAAGKVQLAYLSQLPYRKHPLRRMTDPRPAEVRKLERELGKIREAGYAVDAGGYDHDLTCIAAPVFNDTGEVVGAFSVQAPRFRLSKSTEIRGVADKVLEITRKASEELGFRPLKQAATGS